MRIAMLGHKRVPSREGGVEIVVEELGVRMAAAGHKVTCYNRSGTHVSGKTFQALKQKEYRGIRLKTVPAINIKGIAAMTASFFAAFCAAFGWYDVVHFHAEGPCAMLWLPKLLGKRCIATIHGLDHLRAKWGKFASAYIMLGEKCAVRYADEIIVLNRSNQIYFKEKYGRETRLIPNGVSVGGRCEADLIAARYGLHKDDYVLYLGRIVPEKGVHYLIDAFRKVETGKKLVIAGGASDSSDYVGEIRQMAAQDGRVILTDFVQGQLLAELYSNAYLYVLPSDVEGMPLSLMEAMGYGNCCLVSDIDENAAVVQDAGVTFRRSDVPDLAEKLCMLLAHPEEIDRCRARAAEISRTWDWDDVTQRTLDVYEGGK